MRLIDADAIPWTDLNADMPNSKIRVLITFADKVNRMPTIEERKKGEWMPAFDGKFTGGAYWFSCSECKRIVPEVRNGGWNFCPNCGANMR